MMNKINRRIGILAVLFFLTTSFQQKKIIKDPAIVKITFNNIVKDAKIAFHDSVYINPFGEKYTITKFRYYVSGLSLKNGKQNFSEKNSYHLIDESDIESQSFSFSVPEGNYASLRFFIRCR